MQYVLYKSYRFSFLKNNDHLKNNNDTYLDIKIKLRSKPFNIQTDQIFKTHKIKTIIKCNSFTKSSHVHFCPTQKCPM